MCASCRFTFLQEGFPAIRGANPTMEEAVGFLARNLEADEAEPLSRNNGLLTFTAVDDGRKISLVTSRAALRFLVGQFVSQRFQVLVGSVQACTNLVDRAEYGNVVDSNTGFRFVFLEESLNDQHFFVQGVLRRILRQEPDLGNEVIPRYLAHDVNNGRSFFSIRHVNVCA